jgi:archaellin
MKIVFSTTETSPVILSQGTTADRSTFTVKSGTTDVTALKENEQVEINFKVEPLQPYTKMNVEIRPVVGAVIPFSKTVPATISHTTILY